MTTPDVRGFVLKQPYASLVCAGLKPIDTRTYSTTWRGRLVICAATKMDHDAMVHMMTMTEEQKDVLGACGLMIDAPLGVILCSVELLNVRPLMPEDRPRSWYYAPDRYAWEFGPVTLLPRRSSRELTWEGKPVRCFQGRFRVDPEWAVST